MPMQEMQETWFLSLGLKDPLEKEMATHPNILAWSLGISELKWTGMGEFNSDDHYMYYCGQESLRRNGVAIMVNKRAFELRGKAEGCTRVTAGRTGESGAFGMWPHPRGSSRISSCPL